MASFSVSKYTGLTTKMHPQNELFLPAALHVVTVYVTLRLYGILYPALWNLQMPPVISEQPVSHRGEEMEDIDAFRTILRVRFGDEISLRLQS